LAETRNDGVPGWIGLGEGCAGFREWLGAGGASGAGASCARALPAAHSGMNKIARNAAGAYLRIRGHEETFVSGGNLSDDRVRPGYTSPVYVAGTGAGGVSPRRGRCHLPGFPVRVFRLPPYNEK
jgi:hypothetical protein